MVGHLIQSNLNKQSFITHELGIVKNTISTYILIEVDQATRYGRETFHPTIVLYPSYILSTEIPPSSWDMYPLKRNYLLTPKNGSLPHLPHYMAHLSIFLPYFHQKTHKTIKKASKRLKMPPKGHKTLFSSKKYPKFLQKRKNLQKGI